MKKTLLFLFGALLTHSSVVQAHNVGSIQRVESADGPATVTTRYIDDVMSVSNHRPAKVLAKQSPDGTSHTFEVSAISQSVLWESYLLVEQTYNVKEVIISEDGKVYVPDFLPSVPGEQYIVGQIEGDKVIFNFPQEYVTQYGYDEETGEEYADILSLYAQDYDLIENYDEYTGETTGYYQYYLSDNQTVEFDYNESTGEMKLVGDVAIGLGIEVNGAYYGSNYGVQDIAMVDYTSQITTVELPDDLVYENYVMDNYDYYYNERTKYFVQVAFKDNDMYIKGLFDRDPEMVCCFHEEGGKYVIPFAQCLGTYNMEKVFTYPVVFAEDYQSCEAVDKFEVNVDGDSKTITPTNAYEGLYYNLLLSQIYYWRCFVDFTLQQQDIPDYAVPGKASNLSFHDSMWDDTCYFTFDYNCEAEDGKLLPTSRLFYQFYLDGEPFTFTPEEFFGIDEEMSIVPLNFGDGMNIGGFGTYHYINFEHQNTKSVGVKIYYESIDGDLIAGDLASLDLEGDSVTGIMDLEAPVYYNLSGNRVEHPENGIYIVKTGNNTFKKIVNSNWD